MHSVLAVVVLVFFLDFTFWGIFLERRQSAGVARNPMKAATSHTCERVCGILNRSVWWSGR